MSTSISIVRLNAAAGLASDYLDTNQRVVLFSMLRLFPGEIDDAASSGRRTQHWQYAFGDNPEQGVAVLLNTLSCMGPATSTAFHNVMTKCFPDHRFEDFQPLVPPLFQERGLIIKLLNQLRGEMIPYILQHLGAPTTSNRTEALRYLLARHWTDRALVVEVLTGMAVGTPAATALEAVYSAKVPLPKPMPLIVPQPPPAVTHEMLRVFVINAMCQMQPWHCDIVWALLCPDPAVVTAAKQNLAENCSAPFLREFSAEPGQGVAFLGQICSILRQDVSAIMPNATLVTKLAHKYDMLVTLLYILFKCEQSTVHSILSNLKNVEGGRYPREFAPGLASIVRAYTADPAATAQCIHDSTLGLEFDGMTKYLVAQSTPAPVVSVSFFSSSTPLVALEDKGATPAKKDDEQCLICLDSRRCVATSPCSHMSMCVACYNQMLAKNQAVSCPECRAAVTEARRIYY